MAKLILKFESAVLKQIPLSKPTLSIGRTPGNDVAIDNPAVSGDHARLILEQEHFFVEDLNSRNGTFVNNQRVRKSMLRDGDEILIGKHSLLFVDDGRRPDSAATVEANQGAKPLAEHTVMLDTKQARELLAQAQTIASQWSASPHREKIGCLAVLAGKTDQREYILTGKLSVIGKSEMASVKLRRWFAPKVAAVINRNDDAYAISPSDKVGAAKVNSEILTAARDLNEGDLIEISGAKMKFYYRDK